MRASDSGACRSPSSPSSREIEGGGLGFRIQGLGFRGFPTKQGGFRFLGVEGVWFRGYWELECLFFGFKGSAQEFREGL